MIRFLLVFSFMFFLSSMSSAQTIDTVLVDSVIIEIYEKDFNEQNDTLLNDSELYFENQSDSIFRKDSIHSIQINDTVTSELTKNVYSQDSVPVIKTYEEVLEIIKDSLYFEDPDTLHYVIYNLKNLMSSDSIVLKDSTKQAIQKLIQYSTTRKIDTVISYLKKHLELAFEKEYQDSSLKVYNDSIFAAVKFLIESIPQDSVKLSFTNLINDSVLFEVAENEVDSVRINLYDNRGEYATLWIIKSDKSVFDIYLEDGIYIEKAREQKIVNQGLDADIDFPELREVQDFIKIIPIWTFDGSADIKFNQGYISDSWSEGGESSISALSILKYSADYSFGKKRNLDTDIEYRLGYIQAGNQDLKKNDDKFEINAKYGKQAINDWYYSGLLNFKTQILKGYEYPNDSTKTNISEFLSPAYLVFSLGMDYKPSNKLTILFSPLTSKFTIVADTLNYDQTRFGVAKNAFVREEIGAYIKAISKIKFRDNIHLENKINFFTNYTSNPQNIDVDWEVDLKVKLTDYILMSVNAHFIHDDDVKFINKDGQEEGARAQFKELFGIGFTYSF